MYSTLCTQHKIFSKERKKEERRRRKKWGKVEEERARGRGLWEDDGEGLMLEARGSIEAVLTLHLCLVFFFRSNDERGEDARERLARAVRGGCERRLFWRGGATPHRRGGETKLHPPSEGGGDGGNVFFILQRPVFFGFLLSLLLFFISCLRKHGLFFKYYKSLIINMT